MARVVATVKGVALQQGRVLLARNPREEWELPGGQPDSADSSAAATLVREFREETGLDVVPGRLLLAELFAPIPDARVMVVAFAADVVGGALHASAEHTALHWFSIDDLPERLPQVYRDAIAAAAAQNGTPQ